MGKDLLSKLIAENDKFDILKEYNQLPVGVKYSPKKEEPSQNKNDTGSRTRNGSKDNKQK